MKRVAKTPRGRPRAFDTDRALGAALHVFWRHGYEGASLADLTAAMGINRPSLYAAFGNKEELFRRALRQPTARGAVAALLHAIADAQGNRDNPRGCLMVQSALACGPAGECVKQELIARRAASRAAWRKRFQRAKAEGDLPVDADPADLARYLSAVTAGMSVEAVNGATPAELHRLAETALRFWTR
jgi:AcrR family transcriptional regulator